MSSDRRPGGLTALAVVNFIVAGFSLLGALALLPFLLMGEQMMEGMEGAPEQDQAAIQAILEMGEPWFIVFIAATIITVALLVASGVGYLKLKKFLGRTLGNAYALFTIVYTVISAMVVAPELGGGFSIGTLLGFVYPVITLILLNSTFKEDFVN